MGRDPQSPQIIGEEAAGLMESLVIEDGSYESIDIEWQIKWGEAALPNTAQVILE